MTASDSAVARDSVPESSDGARAPSERPYTPVDYLLRMLAATVVAVTTAFLLNDYLTFWRDWPGALVTLSGLGTQPATDPTAGAARIFGWLQVLFYVAAVAGSAAWVGLSRSRTLYQDADLWSALAAYLVRAAFWATLLVGLSDMIISFLRVEEILAPLVGEHLTTQLGRSIYRGNNIHYPLIFVSLIIAFFVRSLGFTWLALLVVLAEFQIVIWRFVFSYEQAFMGDLVRFWYAALFLFASAHTLVEDGHVRVDVFYARFSARGKAWTNSLGSVLLGWPLCWVILTTGMWGKGSSINNPLLSYEISQSGYGMYVKYLMAGFLLVFAVSMVVQFASYFLSNAAVLRGDPPRETPSEDPGHHG